MEYYSAIKKNKILAFASKWLELESIAKWNKPVLGHQKQNVLSDTWMVTHNKGGEI